MTKPNKPSDAATDLFVPGITHIDPVLIQNEYIKLPAHLARANAVLVSRTEDYLHAKHAFEKTEAQISIEMREIASGKMTVNAVRDQVLVDKRYELAHLVLIDAEIEMRRVRAVVDAIHAKKEMLISLGATIRKELDDPRIRDQARDARASNND